MRTLILIVLISLPIIVAVGTVCGNASGTGGSGSASGTAAVATVAFSNSAASGSWTVVSNQLIGTTAGSIRIQFQGTLSTTCSGFGNQGQIDIWDVTNNIELSGSRFTTTVGGAGVNFNVNIPAFYLMGARTYEVRIKTGTSCSVTASNVVFTIDQPICA